MGQGLLLTTRSLRSLDESAVAISYGGTGTDFLLCRPQLNGDKRFNGAGDGKAKGATLPYSWISTTVPADNSASLLRAIPFERIFHAGA
jgi:hypothetical protein